ncbi:GntR family transcriptional regulator [Roseovarius sp. Pro17]|uniref:GntR family transcriptional regulator n=1 Tax=Roseovarius sp. Pro17 TaxID=3108175 RepID=UPI002D7A3C5B|nr:GntR family transcriptional regulator [Roseovarius sp. Pro17]
MEKTAASTAKAIHGKPRERVVSLRSEAYQTIRRQIINCTLKPGEAVTLTDLASDLDIGRTPVSQAVDRLTLEGLMEVIPRKGIVVAPVSIDDLVQIIEVRLLTEAQAVRWAAERAGADDIAAMRRNLDGNWTAARAKDIDAMISFDSEFHRLLNGASGNRILADLVGNLHDRSIRFWSISLRAANHGVHVCEQHTEILEGIAAGDPDRAEKAVRAHITAFNQNIMAQLLRL